MRVSLRTRLRDSVSAAVVESDALRPVAPPPLRLAWTSLAVARPDIRLSIFASYSSLAWLMLFVMASIVDWAWL